MLKRRGVAESNSFRSPKLQAELEEKKKRPGVERLDSHLPDLLPPRLKII